MKIEVCGLLTAFLLSIGATNRPKEDVGSERTEDQSASLEAAISTFEPLEKEFEVVQAMIANFHFRIKEDLKFLGIETGDYSHINANMAPLFIYRIGKYVLRRVEFCIRLELAKLAFLKFMGAFELYHSILLEKGGCVDKLESFIASYQSAGSPEHKSEDETGKHGQDLQQKVKRICSSIIKYGYEIYLVSTAIKKILYNEETNDHLVKAPVALAEKYGKYPSLKGDLSNFGLVVLEDAVDILRTLKIDECIQFFSRSNDYLLRIQQLYRDQVDPNKPFRVPIFTDVREKTRQCKDDLFYNLEHFKKAKQKIKYSYGVVSEKLKGLSKAEKAREMHIIEELGDTKRYNQNLRMPAPHEEVSDSNALGNPSARKSWAPKRSKPPKPSKWNIFKKTRKQASD